MVTGKIYAINPHWGADRFHTWEQVDEKEDVIAWLTFSETRLVFKGSWVFSSLTGNFLLHRERDRLKKASRMTQETMGRTNGCI